MMIVFNAACLSSGLLKESSCMEFVNMLGSNDAWSHCFPWSIGIVFAYVLVDSMVGMYLEVWKINSSILRKDGEKYRLLFSIINLPDTLSLAFAFLMRASILEKKFLVDADQFELEAVYRRRGNGEKWKLSLVHSPPPF